jgi:phosphate transport system protein
MTHYEERLEQDLSRINKEIRDVGTMVEEALQKATRALLALDKELAYAVVLGDHRINRAVRHIDQLCHAFVVRHLPSAGPLRFISSVLRLGREIERIGDYAVTIGRETVQLNEAPAGSIARDLDLLAHQSRQVLNQSVKAFVTGNAELARGTKSSAVQISEIFERAFSDLTAGDREGPQTLQNSLAWLVALNSLERVADRAKNICEETIFAVVGETKQPKTFKVLFIDRRNDGRSQIAEAYARKAFPTYGIYRSVGWDPSSGLDPVFVDLMGKSGHDLSEARPSPMEVTPDELSEFHFIIALEEGVEEHIPAIPFHTVLLKWISKETSETAVKDWKAFESSYQEISLKIRELFEILRGEEAL